MDFGEVLNKAWKIIWKFKVLWLFGILAGCGQGSGGGSSSNYKSFNTSNGNLPPELRRFFAQIGRFFNTADTGEILLIIGGLILFFLILWLVMLSLSTVGKVGLIQGTVKADQGGDILTFGELFESGKPFFWRILGLNFLLGFIITAATLLLILPIIGITAITMGIGLICLFPLICIFIPVVWLANIVIEQANIALIVEDLGIRAAIIRGWEIVRDNSGNMAIMALILLLGGAGVRFVLAIPFVLIAIPIFIGIAGGIASESESILNGGLAIAGLCFVAYLPVLIFLNGILRSYIAAAWTLVYLRLSTAASAPVTLKIPPDDF